MFILIILKKSSLMILFLFNKIIFPHSILSLPVTSNKVLKSLHINIPENTYNDKNSLYKDGKTGRYMLVINKIEDTTENFNKAYNILSEYGKLERMLPSSEFFFKEHYECVIEDVAIQSLSKVM